jgi:aryl-alcohol dehydrogenase-like predicted oxidoreductase
MVDRLQPSRDLGSTGVKVPLVGYGTAPLGKTEISREQAVRCLNHAIDRGMTYLDTSPDYGSEPHLGEVMRTRRDEVFLATKVNRRSKEGVLAELRESLEKLQTDHVDLIQVHAVNAWADLEATLAPDGALAALEEAKRQGMVRFIGITGHARPEILAHALTQHRFDTVLCALGIFDHIVSGADRLLLPRAREQDVGVIAMKVLGHGTIDRRATALHFSLGLPGVSLAIVGLKSVEEIDEVIANALAFRQLRQAETQELIEHVKPLAMRDAKEASEKGESPLFWLHDTKVTGWEAKDEPAIVTY